MFARLKEFTVNTEIMKSIKRSISLFLQLPNCSEPRHRLRFKFLYKHPYNLHHTNTDECQTLPIRILFTAQLGSHLQIVPNRRVWSMFIPLVARRKTHIFLSITRGIECIFDHQRYWSTQKNALGSNYVHCIRMHRTHIIPPSGRMNYAPEEHRN